MTCQVCHCGQLFLMGPLIVCANCEKAWVDWEYLAAVDAAFEEYAEPVESTEA